MPRWIPRLAVLAAAATTATVAVAAPAYAAALTNVSWSLSNPQPSSTSVRYTWSFTTATTGTIASVTFTVPAGTAGVPSVVDVYGLTGGSAALVGTTVTYTVTTPASVASGTSILVSLDGFTNTGTANSAYTSTVTTVVGGVNTDTAASSAVGINSNTTAVNVVVARSTGWDRLLGEIDQAIGCRSAGSSGDFRSTPTAASAKGSPFAGGRKAHVRLRRR